MAGKKEKGYSSINCDNIYSISTLVCLISVLFQWNSSRIPVDSCGFHRNSTGMTGFLQDSCRNRWGTVKYCLIYIMCDDGEESIVVAWCPSIEREADFSRDLILVMTWGDSVENWEINPYIEHLLGGLDSVFTHLHYSTLNGVMVWDLEGGSGMVGVC